ncbi:MAG TPA: hypothetical protein VMW53_09810, partial [archaeon]|nr:hypothetical protein [archaeon]
MKKIFLMLLIGMLPFSIWAQDSKVSDLTATTTVDDDDLFYIIDGGTTSKKITGAYMKSGIGVFPVDARVYAAGNLLYESFWLGEDAGINNVSGTWNYGIGTRAHYSLTSGDGNSSLGFNAGYSITSGGGNHFVGFQSGYSADTSHFNTAIGW